MTVCTFTIAQDTSGSREGAGKWLSNSLVQVLLGGGESLAAPAAAAAPPPLPLPPLPSPSPSCKNYTNDVTRLCLVPIAYISSPDVRSMGGVFCLFFKNEFPPGVVKEE